MRKKILALSLSAALVFCMTVPVLASEGDGESRLFSMDMRADVHSPEIRAAIDKNAYMIVNPYHLSFKTGEGGTLENTSIISPEIQIWSVTQAPVRISMKAIAKMSGEARLADIVREYADAVFPGKGIQDKQIFLYAEFPTVNEDGQRVYADGYSAENPHQVRFTAEGERKANIGQIPAYRGSLETAGDAASVEGPDAPVSVAFKIRGDMSDAPLDNWSAEDVPACSLVLDFELGRTLTAEELLEWEAEEAAEAAEAAEAEEASDTEEAAETEVTAETSEGEE